MWYLTGPTGELIYIKVNKDLTFGRKKSDIILQNDDSVSRVHASLCIVPKDIVARNGIISNCILKDLGSKYGTYVLSDDLSIAVTKEGYNVNDQDKIRFGLQQHIFTVHYKPIITVVSALNKNDKERLQNLMNEIDGLISSEWINMCTHLTVSMATLTEKVTWAMTCVKPIVNVDYWVEVKSAIDEGKEMPKFTNFVPDIREELVIKEKVSLFPNEQRKTLFMNLIFVYFSTRQYKTYGKMINMAGGKSVLYSKQPLNNKGICAVNVVVLQYSSGDASQSTQCLVPEYDSIYDILRKNKRRMISELEIPLAILHCSVETYCNPKFKFSNLLKRSQAKYDTADVLALDTQDVLSDVRILPKIISNVPVKSAINIKPVEKKIVNIPETYETPSFSMDCLSNVESQQNSKSKVAKKYIPETASTCDSTCSTLEKNKRNDERLELPKKNTKFIPETMDTCDFTISEKSTNEKIPARGTQTVIPESLGTQSNEKIDNIMITKRGIPLKDVIVINVADGNGSREKQSNKTKSDENFSEVSLKKKVANLQPVCEIIDISLEESSEKTESPVKKRHASTLNEGRDKISKISQERDKNKEKCKIILGESSDETEPLVEESHSPTLNKGHDKTPEKLQERGKNKEKCKIILEDSSDEIEPPVEERHPPKPNKARHKEPQILQESEKNKEQCKKGKKRSNEFDKDEFDSTVRKEAHIDNFMEGESFKSPLVTSTPRFDNEKNVSNSLIRKNSSFFRENIGSKTFRKVYTNVPTKRITLKEMYVWHGENSVN